MNNLTHAVVLEKPGRLGYLEITIPEISGPAERVTLGSCGICGSDVRYFQGENPWSLHTLGKNLPSPPNMVLGHEVSGTVTRGRRTRRVAVLAYRACGRCEDCESGCENRCTEMQHFGHSAGWPKMDYYPGGMSESFDIWQGFAREIPSSISFDEAVFLDGLAVAIHVVDRSLVTRGSRVAVLGLGPIGMLAAQVSVARGAGEVAGCDLSEVPVRLTKRIGLEGVVHGDATSLRNLHGGNSERYDAVIDTVGSEDTIIGGLRLLKKGGTLNLVAVHEKPLDLVPSMLSGERMITTSANNPYRDFAEAIRLIATKRVQVDPFITHRFPLSEAAAAFDAMLDKDGSEAYKVVLHR